MNTRIQELLNKLKIAPSKFADEIGVPRSTISHIISGRNKPSLDFITKVIEKYPDISVDWIIFGKGETFKTGANINEMQVNNDQPDLFSYEDEQVASNDIESADNKEKEEEKDQGDKAIEQAEVDKQQIRKSTAVVSQEIEKIIMIYNDNTFSEYKRK